MFFLCYFFDLFPFIFSLWNSYYSNLRPPWFIFFFVKIFSPLIYLWLLFSPYFLAYWARKKPSPFSPECLLYSCSTDTHTTLLRPGVCGVFPTKQSCNTSWVSYHLTQFWHSLPGDSVRFHRVRTQFHKTAPHFRCQSQVVGPQGTHNFCPTWPQITSSHNLHLGFT